MATAVTAAQPKWHVAAVEYVRSADGKYKQYSFELRAGAVGGEVHASAFKHRYSEFDQLRKQLTGKYKALVGPVSFPKKMHGGLKAKFGGTSLTSCPKTISTHIGDISDFAPCSGLSTW